MPRTAGRVLTAALLAMSAFVMVAQAQEYPSVPKGVVCEGAAIGIEPVNSITYDRNRNGFVINGNSFYQNPISKEDFRELLGSLAQHNHIGVSIRPDRTFFTYGNISPNSRIARDLAAADRLLGGVVFGMREYIGNRRLPGGYVPKSLTPQQRRILSACTWHFRDFRFAKGGQNVYQRVDYNLDSTLTPVRRDSRARDGGYTSDVGNTNIEPADRENHNHILSNRGEYMAMPEVDRAAKIGEAAAFIRWVRGGMANRGVISGGRPEVLNNLAQQMR